ncbi:MAG: proteasome subunit alpha, partial [Actinomycetales bacterium]
PARSIAAGDLEAAVLDRTRTQPRKFKRLDEATIATALAG